MSAQGDFKTTHFIPPHRQSQILTSPITKITAVGHTQESGTNHWRLYVDTSPDQTGSTSVRLDCVPSYTVPSTVPPGGSKANIVLSELTVPISSQPDTEVFFPLDIIPDLTVGDVYDTLARHGRLNYEFDDNGVGCRYWTMQQIELLRDLGFVTSLDQVDAATSGISTLWPNWTPLALDRGTYY